MCCNINTSKWWISANSLWYLRVSFATLLFCLVSAYFYRWWCKANNHFVLYMMYRTQLIGLCRFKNFIRNDNIFKLFLSRWWSAVSCSIYWHIWTERLACNHICDNLLIHIICHVQCTTAGCLYSLINLWLNFDFFTYLHTIPNINQLSVGYLWLSFLNGVQQLYPK